MGLWVFGQMIFLYNIRSTYTIRSLEHAILVEYNIRAQFRIHGYDSAKLHVVFVDRHWIIPLHTITPRSFEMPK